MTRSLSPRSYGGDRARQYGDAEEEEAAQPTEVDQQARLPTVDGPKLYLVKVRPGKERETVICLMQKAKSLLEAGGDAAAAFRVTSVACQDHLKGFIYVEATKKPFVKDALKGVRNVFGSFEPQLVPVPEMVASISVAQKATAVFAVGSWVRLRNSVYKGDLGRVVALRSADGRADVRLVPRFDYVAIAERRSGADKPAKPTLTEEELAGGGAGGASVRGGRLRRAPTEKRPRPIARLFWPDAAELVSLPTESATSGTIGRHTVFAGVHRLIDGYLIKDTSIGSLVHEPAPTFAELQRFTAAEAAGAAGGGGAGGGGGIGGDGAGGSSLAALAATLGGGPSGGDGAALPPPQAFAVGDSVVVTAAGDLHGLRGRVDAVLGGGEVRVAADQAELSHVALVFKSSELAKDFAPGAHVRVAAGAHAGAVGMVLRGEPGGVVVLLTDVMKSELRAFSRDCVDAGDAADGGAALGDFALFDLVLLEDGVAGIIVAVQQEAAVVLTHNGPPDRPETRACRLPDILRRLPAASNTALDKGMATVARGDVVRVVEGPMAGKAGTVEWAHHGFVFVRSRDVRDNAGVMCVRSKSTLVAGGGGRGGGGGAGGGAGGGYSALGLASPAVGRASPAHGAFGGGTSATGAFAVPASPRLGQPLAASAGAGRSRVVATSRFSRKDDFDDAPCDIVGGGYKGYRGIVKFHTDAQCRVELEANEKTVTIETRFLRIRGVAASSNALPGIGAANPYAQGSATPAREIYGRTPVHGGSGSMTPGREAWAMTPGREAFGATPARPNPWDTPSRGGSADASAFGALSAFGSGGATPSRQPTPGVSDAYGSMDPGVAIVRGSGGGGGAATPASSGGGSMGWGRSAPPASTPTPTASSVPLPSGTIGWGGRGAGARGGAPASTATRLTDAPSAQTPAASEQLLPPPPPLPLPPPPPAAAATAAAAAGPSPAEAAAAAATAAAASAAASAATAAARLLPGFVVRRTRDGVSPHDQYVVRRVAPDGSCLLSPLAPDGTVSEARVTDAADRLDVVRPSKRAELAAFQTGPHRGKWGRVIAFDEEDAELNVRFDDVDILPAMQVVKQDLLVLWCNIAAA